jgi:hypothetical protein
MPLILMKTSLILNSVKTFAGQQVQSLMLLRYCLKFHSLCFLKMEASNKELLHIPS